MGAKLIKKKNNNMKKHIIFIDPIEKLVVKKDSSLLLAHELKALGEDVSIAFKNDLSLLSHESGFFLTTFSFESKIGDDFYLHSFEMKDSEELQLSSNTIFHMRLEPPFDLSYMRSLWMLNFLKEKTGMRIINDPSGIMLNNEKITSFHVNNSIDTYIGASLRGFENFIQVLKKKNYGHIIIKPLDLFQGMGVEKVDLGQSESDIKKAFETSVLKNNGQIMVQPFLKEVQEGEVRAVYFQSEKIGAIKKMPKEGSYLANIAQGASFKRVDLNEIQHKSCLEICHSLGKDVPWVAFDIIGNNISEVNVTCPGLLVEVSKAEGTSLAKIIAKKIAVTS